MKILLHTCCGPCASACVPRLKKAGHTVAMLFANSNIDTAEEFERRRAAAGKLAAEEGVELAVAGYRHEEWLEEVANGLENEPEKGDRCRRCYRYNIAIAAKYAVEHGFDAVTTSLTVSPHKPSALVFEAGREAAGKMFAVFDFKKDGGFAESTRRAKEFGLYRQDYCGCEFSKRRSR